MEKNNDLDKIVENFLAPRGTSIDFASLCGMIEEILDTDGLASLTNIRRLNEDVEAAPERVIKFPKIKITENWGSKNNEDRAIFETLMRNVRGNTIQEKLQAVSDFLEHQEGLPIAEILSNLMFVEIFSNILEEFNPSTAGFLFEAFLAGLFQGVQIDEPEGGSLPIEDVELFVKRGFGENAEQEVVPYSLKVLSPNTDLKGSFKNLVDFFRKPENERVIYLAVTKVGGTGAVGKLQFYEFEINKDNFFDWIGHETISAERILDTFEFTPRSDGSMESNYLTYGNLKIGGRPTRGKMDGDQFIKAPSSKSTVATRTNYQDIDGEEVVVFKPTSLALRDATRSGKSGLAMSFNGERLQPDDYIFIDRTYTIVVDTGEKEYVRTGEKSSGHKKLYGDGQYDWDTVMNNPESIPGYSQNKQWHVAPRYYREMGNKIGEIDLSQEKLKTVFDAYAIDLGESLVGLYNALSALSININKYFLDSDKGAGMQAIGNAGTVKEESEKLIDQPK